MVQRKSIRNLFNIQQRKVCWKRICFDSSVKKCLLINVLKDIVDKYNNKDHQPISMKPIDLKFDSYAECNNESNKKDPKFKGSDQIKISKYQKHFC